MARPTTYGDGVVTSGMRLPKDLHARLLAAADERDVSANWLVKRALEDYLDRLIPVDEVRWTRDRS